MFLEKKFGGLEACPGAQGKDLGQFSIQAIANTVDSDYSRGVTQDTPVGEAPQYDHLDLGHRDSPPHCPIPVSGLIPMGFDPRSHDTSF